MVCGFLYTSRWYAMAIPGWLTFAVFIRDFLIVFTAYLMWTRVQVTRFPPSVAGKASTLLQAITLVVVVAVNAFLPWLAAAVEVLFRISLLVTLYSGWGYLRRAALLLQSNAKTPRFRRLDKDQQAKYFPRPFV